MVRISKETCICLHTDHGTGVFRLLWLLTCQTLLKKSGDKIHVDKLSAKLGCEACEISALKGTGIDVAVKKKQSHEEKANKSVAPVHEFSEEVEKYITADRQ